MALLDCCSSAAQCTSFRNKEVPLPRIYDLIKTATYAPEAAHADNLEFVIVRKQEVKKKIADQCPGQSWISSAPCMILVVNDNAKAKTLYGSQASMYCTQTVGAAAYSIVLQAYEFGLAAFWVRLSNSKAIARIAEVPEGKIVEAILLVGYPREKQKHENPTAVDKITFLEKYGKKEA